MPNVGELLCFRDLWVCGKPHAELISQVWSVARIQSPMSGESLWALTTEVKCESVVGHLKPHLGRLCATARVHVMHRHPVGFQHRPMKHQASVVTNTGGTTYTYIYIYIHIYLYMSEVMGTQKNTYTSSDSDKASTNCQATPVSRSRGR
jgi:hypothetical protein